MRSIDLIISAKQFFLANPRGLSDGVRSFSPELDPGFKSPKLLSYTIEGGVGTATLRLRL